MRKEIYRKNQTLSLDATKEILSKSNHGVLGLNGDDGYIYTVPVSFVRCQNKIYFHGRPAGHKSDSFKRTSKTSFCVVDQSFVVPKLRANDFRSVIVWGTLEKVDDIEEKVLALRALANKLCFGIPDNEEEIQSTKEYVEVYALKIEHITGKEALLEVRLEGDKMRKLSINHR